MNAGRRRAGTDARDALPVDGPRAILRVLQVLGTLSAEPRGLSLSALGRRLDLPKTTLHTMLRTLEQARYVVHVEGMFRLGSEALRLGASIVGAPRSFPDCALGLLDEVARRTGETALLAELTADRRSCRYLASVETDNWLRFSVPVGSLKPAYATGSGQAMLAWLDDAALRDALAGVDFAPITSGTVRSRTALARALRDVRKRGVSTVDGGTVAGVVAVAAPIFDRDGACVGAITVGGPTSRLETKIAEVEREVGETALQASRLLGYLGEWPPGKAAPARGPDRR